MTEQLASVYRSPPASEATNQKRSAQSHPDPSPGEKDYKMSTQKDYTNISYREMNPALVKKDSKMSTKEDYTSRDNLISPYPETTTPTIFPESHPSCAAKDSKMSTKEDNASQANFISSCPGSPPMNVPKIEQMSKTEPVDVPSEGQPGEEQKKKDCEQGEEQKKKDCDCAWIDKCLHSCRIGPGPRRRRD